jgi:hypothetical protein
MPLFQGVVFLFNFRFSRSLSIHKEYAINCNVFSLHQNHSELKERLSQVDQVVNLPLFSVSDLELRVPMIRAVFVLCMASPLL